MSAGRVITTTLHRAQAGHGKRFTTAAPVPAPSVRRPARVAVMLALAHKIRSAVERGAVRDQAEVARRLGLTRARLTQLLNLLSLSPDLQERVLVLEAVDGAEPLTERSLREVTHEPDWSQQRMAFDGMLTHTPRPQGK
jgi:hypothetical protein